MTSEYSAKDDSAFPAPLVEVRRGPIIESRHRGHVVVLEPEDSVVASLGSPETVTYMRSSAKPHQAIPLVASGAADRFGFDEREIALASASHNGEPIHTETVASMLNKIGIEPDALKCGVHEPYGQDVARSMRERGEKPNVLHNNCSGKHAGMLALALHLGAPTDTYDHPENPVQVAIRDCVSQFSGVPANKIPTGIDGCGVPVFAVSLKAMALMYLRLVSPAKSFDDKTRWASRRIAEAMVKHPELIGGTKDRLDTEVMRAGGGRVLSKVGAEGVYTMAVFPCEKWPGGLGMALKIEDGDDLRARPTVVIEALRQLGVLSDGSLEALATYRSFVLRNRRGEQVGEVRARFELVKGNA